MSNKPLCITANNSTCMQNNPELSNKTIDELLYAVEDGLAYEYLNDVEPSNTLVLC